MTKFPGYRYILPLLILWLAFGLRLYRIDFQSIWWDEGHSIFVASQPISEIPTLPAMDVHPPAYFTLLHLWMGLAGRSAFALRYLSLIFGLLTIALLWRFQLSINNYQLTIDNYQLSISNPPHPFLLAPFLASLSPFYVAYSQEVRSYAMITCLALASTFVLWRLLFPGRRRDTGRKRGSLLLVYVILSAACLYTHYFSVFLLLFHNLVWLVWLLRGRPVLQHDCETSEPNFAQTNVQIATKPIIKPRITQISRIFTFNFKELIRVIREIRGSFETASMGIIEKFRSLVVKQNYLRNTFLLHAGLWLGSQVGILLLFLPQLMLAWRQVTSYTNPNLTPPGLLYFISRSWQAYTVGLTFDPTPAQWGMGVIAGVLIVGWLTQFVRQWPAPSPYFYRRLFAFCFLLFWLFIPLAAYFVVLQGQPSFEPRYMILATPALFLLLALGLTSPLPSPAQSVSPLPHPPEQGLPGRRPTARTIHFTSLLPSSPPSTPSSLLPTPYSLLLTFYALRFTLLFPFLIGLNNYYTNASYFKDDSAGVARWLAAETRSNDIIYVDAPHPFHYYAEQAHIPAPLRYLFVDIHTAAETLTKEAAGRERLFWVTWWGSDTDPRGVIPFLAEKTGSQAGQRDFKGYRVTWFDLPTQGPVVFSLPESLTPAGAIFGDKLRLDGLAFGEASPAHEPVWVTLHFSLLQASPVNYKVSLRLRDEAGQVVAQLDRDLLNDRHFRTSAWPLNDPALNQATNVYLLSPPPDTPPGSYRLEAVVYNAEPPYSAEGVAGHESLDGVAAVLGDVTLLP